MRRLLLLLPLLLAAGPAWGQARSIEKPFDVPDWTIAVLTSQSWHAAMNQYGTIYGQTALPAFTILETRRTYLNPDYVKRLSTGQLRNILAHEAGHLLCNCSDEKKANRFADDLLKVPTEYLHLR